MADHICLQTPNVLVKWDERGGFLLIKYEHWIDAQQIKDAIPTFVQAVREHHATRCLSDSRLRRVVQPDAQQAFVHSGIPQAAAAGLKRVAMVPPASVVAQTTVMPMVAEYRKYLEAEIFTTVDEAVAWLRADAP